MIDKPDALFDRDAEWGELSSFATDDRLGATLALVYGRRRQGKTLLLELLAESVGGMLLTGLEQSSLMNLAAVGETYAQHRGLGAAVTFASWSDALDALLAVGEGAAPALIVIDEFPYLLRSAPELPSVLQRALSPRGRARQRSRTRIVLCGSAFSVMRNLLAGSAALRGRATREVVVHPFDYRQARAFWGIEDVDLAARVHALVGGTPAYLDYADGQPPADAGSFDDWVVQHVLNPSSAFFREGRLLVGEEPTLGDSSLYFSVLAALSTGRTRRSEIASALGRTENALAHPLAVLQDTRLVEARVDALRGRRTTYHIAEPMLRSHQLIISPHEARLARRHGMQVWTAVQPTVSSAIYGPHFEELCREWARYHAAPQTVGGLAESARASALACPAHRQQHEIDVVVHADGRVSAIGEAKWRQQPIGIDQLDRLRHIRTILPPAQAPEPPRLLLFSRNGFEPELRQEARAAQDVELIDLSRLYRGD
ncbi:MAG: ATP-binding protein [Pseudonocardiales bacterium]